MWTQLHHYTKKHKHEDMNWLYGVRSLPTYPTEMKRRPHTALAPNHYRTEFKLNKTIKNMTKKVNTIELNRLVVPNTKENFSTSKESISNGL